MRAFLLLALAFSAEALARRDAVVEASAANPIRRVVTLLQNMAKKVATEGKAEEELFDKYMCYCKSAGGDLQGTINSNTAKVPQLQTQIEEAIAGKKQAEADLKSAQDGRAEAKKSGADAAAIRKKEAAAFAKEKAELDSYLAALNKAIPAIEKGMSGSFLQSSTASVLKKVVEGSTNLSDMDRESLTIFLSGTRDAAGYSPKSGEITGILKQMRDEFQKDLDGATADESTAIANHKALQAALAKQIEAHTTAIEKKTKQIGDLAVAIVTMQNDLSDSEEALIEDQKFLADMDKNCASKTAEWEERKKTRAQELIAIHDTIKILNDDDALELFKKTLPGGAFLQIKANQQQVAKRALDIVKSVRSDNMEFIALALNGKKVDFGKVIKMIDDMVALLAVEQQDDDNKREYCNAQIDSTEDKLKGLKQKIGDLEATIAAANDSLATLKDEIKTLTKEIKSLDKAVAEATENRKEENDEYKELMASDGAAKDLLNFAKNRLNKFYNPKLYKAPPKRELSEEERISVNMGGTLAPTAAPGGIAGTGVTAFIQVSKKDAPPPPPETFGAYSKKGGESGGVIAMVDLLIKDLDKEMTEAKADEKNAQADYEKTMADSAAKRAEMSKSMTDKKAAKADSEGSLESATEEKKSTTKEFLATGQVLQNTHGECDWLLQNFDLRKEARAGEVDALGRAKAVLSGADYSFLQVSAHAAPEDDLAKEMTHDLEMNFNKIAPFGKEDTAKELQDHAAKTQDTLVDAVENAEVAEIKRAVFRALTRLRAATIKEFDTIARLETQAIDAYNDAHHYRAENPLTHLHEDEAPVETDKLKSFH